MQLEPCVACRRHIGVGVPCPFCASPAVDVAPRPGPAHGRFSRALVFAGATLVTATACGGKSKPAAAQEPAMEEQENYQNHPCLPPDEERAANLEKQKEASKNEIEKERLQRDIDEARHGACAPYGAPPRRRRVV